MTDHDDLLDRLDQDYAPGWKPEPGDKIGGTIVDITQRDGSWGPYPILELDLGNSERVAVHAVHSVLANELRDRRPAIGDRIAIKYLGKQTGKGGGADYEGYKVVHDPRNGQTAVWGDQGPATPTATSTAPHAPTATGDDEFPF